MHLRSAHLALFAALLFVPSSLPSHAVTPPLQVRVVVVATFEVGSDTGDEPGELQNWVTRYPFTQTLPFPAGGHILYWNPQDHVLAVLSGVGKSHTAATITALGLDPRFDLHRSYWVLAGIGGIDPNVASIGSAAWAQHVVDGDLAYEIDAREIPSAWLTGIVAYDRASPYEPPTPPAVSDNGTLVYNLNAGLAAWAFQLTSSVSLPDDANLQSARAAYTGQPNAQRPPFVLVGDTLTADRFWIGNRMNDWAERWVSYWTSGKGRFATSAEEDSAYLQALTQLSAAGRVDLARVLDLRTASDFTAPPPGVTPAQLLKSEATGNYAAYAQSIENAYRVASPVVRELASHWPRYQRTIPAAQP
ncbi:MAG TPA: purine nucleoside permease [Terracidiphilus sp.]|nr:purine nucleoside permease [Terracidiphilus sp.]